MNSGKSKWEF